MAGLVYPGGAPTVIPCQWFSLDPWLQGDGTMLGHSWVQGTLVIFAVADTPHSSGAELPASLCWCGGCAVQWHIGEPAPLEHHFCQYLPMQNLCSLKGAPPLL